MTSPSPERHVFLSHRSVDKSFVRKLKAALEDTSDGLGGYSCWLDEAEIQPGQSITSLVNDGLERSRVVAIVMTPAYFASESGWTDAEWHASLFLDPDNRRGRIVPILAASCPHIPVLLRHLSAIDMRGRAFKEGVSRLRAHLRGDGAAPASTYRGQVISASNRIDRSSLVAERAAIDALPQQVPEVLQSNLLPVVGLPRELHTAPILRSLCEVTGGKVVKVPTKGVLVGRMDQLQRDAGVARPRHPAFRLVGDRVATFHDLEDEDAPLAGITEDDDIQVTSTASLLNLADDGRVVMSLLNMALERHAYSVGLVPDRTRFGRFYFPPEEGRERKISWKPFKRATTRTVAKPIRQDGAKTLWIHQGAYLKFLNLGGRLYLQIEPTWVISEDGESVKGGPQVGSIVSRWTSPERNLQVFYHVRFWAATLRRSSQSPGVISMRAGDQLLEIRSRPAMINLPVGIQGDQSNLDQQLDVEAEMMSREEEARLVELTADARSLEELLAAEEDAPEGSLDPEVTE